MSMHSEIGSEFWDVPTKDKVTEDIFSQDTQWYLSGRVALKAIISDILKENDCRNVGMPSWCCESMIKPFVDAGMEVYFYPVRFDGGFVQEAIHSTDVLLILDYFGYTGNSINLNGYKGVIIRDVTHSIFSATFDDADYYFGSLRKWCGIWTGGFTWTRDGHQLEVNDVDDFGYVNFRKKAMTLKEQFINNQEGEKREYRKLFEYAENSLDMVEMSPAAKKDIWCAKHLDVDLIKEHRRRNAKMLMDAFKDLLLFPEMRDMDCPMFVPIMIPDGKREELRKYLIEKEIYCPIHWPLSEYHKENMKKDKIYQSELSLVCDQRYDADDMRRMIGAINTWKKRECKD